MILELESVFNTPGLTQAFACTLPPSYDALPFAQPPDITGQVKNRAGVVTLEGSAKVQLQAQCDRCAGEFLYEDDVKLHHTLVRSRNDDENDELILLDSYRFSPDDLFWEDIVFAMPQKLLCAEDCAGLCHCCGHNRNEGPCACKPQGDPRLAALKQLLDDTP